MMNLAKSLEFFNPMDLKKPCRIIGCGAIGSTVAVLLARLGVENIHLYDFDTVESKNIANQQYFHSDIKQEKVGALGAQLNHINPSCIPTVYTKGYTDNMPLTGYVFLCVDNIDIRRQIATQHRFNENIIAMFDFRMRLADAQHYAADWSNQKSVENFLATMDFTHEEAKDATPVSACGTTLSVMPTVTTVCSLGVANFMNLVKGKGLKSMILIDAFDFTVDAM